ncbi:unnamed protein product [Ophioblennius macclurei]
MEDEEVSDPLTALRVLRASLVDELEGHVDSLLDALVSGEALGRDDREEVLCLPGPRARVRKLLDILECKGGEAAGVLFSAWNRQRKEAKTDESPSKDYIKLKQKHKDVLRRRSESMLFYNTRHGEKILFSEHYVNLLLVDGHQGLEVKRHEVLTFGQKRLSMQQKSVVHKKITPDELFSSAKRPVRKVLVTGVAGIGKTILVQKMLLDFGGNKGHLTFDFILHMTFRDLNLIEKPTSFRELVLRKNRHLAKELDDILANDEKLLIILDGFDEFRHYRSCDGDAFVTEPDEDAEVKEIFESLMQGELLPNASVLLTTRPAAVGHIPVGCVDRFVLIAGFSLAEVRDFFSRYFQDGAVAERMFRAALENELMLTLCYIPAFCCIVCCILDQSKDACEEERPKTMTDIYVQYLAALLRSHARARDETAARQLPDVVLQLGRLAFRKLMEHQTLFYSSDRDVAALEKSSLVSTFLDTTVAQEPGCTEEVFSFAHLTIQEFFAALYCAVTDQTLPADGHLDLFYRFLSGILSERNSNFLSRQLGLRCHQDKVDTYRDKIVTELTALCESGAHVLNCIHCMFEQQDPSLARGVRPESLRVNVSDETLSQMDYNAIRYFLDLTSGTISELDLTGTAVSADALRDLRPLLLRCERLWLGENELDTDSVEVIADVLRESETITHLGLGWSNIGDDEIITLSRAIAVKKKLKELWMEGNRMSYRGLLALNDLIPHPLNRVVAIWNDLTDVGPQSVLNQKSITLSFTDDDTWETWGDWVFKRCEVNSNEKLVMFLHKVCNLSAQCLETKWVMTFYTKLSRLIKSRIESCTEEDICKKLRKFENILNL